LGRSSASRAVIAAAQSMQAISMAGSVMPVSAWMKRAKSSRSIRVPWAMSWRRRALLKSSFAAFWPGDRGQVIDGRLRLTVLSGLRRKTRRRVAAKVPGSGLVVVAVPGCQGRGSAWRRPGCGSALRCSAR
jgi:hypothetical protein